MSSLFQLRASRELAQRTENLKSAAGIILNYGPISQDLVDWEASFAGVPATPYEGGVYRLLMKLPSNYPYSPPQIQFLTKIYHSNIDEHGNVDCRIADNWSSSMTIFAYLISIATCFTCAEMQYPLREDILFPFMKRAVEWNHQYANGLSFDARGLDILTQPLRHFELVDKCIAQYYRVQSSIVAELICAFALEYRLHDLPFQNYQPWIQYIEEQHHYSEEAT